MSDIRYTVVVPLYFEEEVIEACHQRLSAVMNGLGESYEIIYVNDGSRDRTGLLARAICKQDSHARLITFSRNFGHQTAITAGMDHASGDAVIVIDADLQDPPEVIPKLIERWREGYEVVYGRRSARAGESPFKKATARIFYRLLRRLTSVDIPVDVGDFRLIDGKVCRTLAALPEHNRYVRGLIAWLGFSQSSVDYARDPRLAGKTKYPLRKMIKLAVDGITSFSYKPLQLGIGLGLALSGFSFLFAIFIFVARLFNLRVMEPGYASLMVVILFFFGVVLVMLGFIGEYIGRLFEEAKNRPLYIIADKTGDLGTTHRAGGRSDGEAVDVSDTDRI